jgi:hypothetical protein
MKKKKLKNEMSIKLLQNDIFANPKNINDLKKLN